MYIYIYIYIYCQYITTINHTHRARLSTGWAKTSAQLEGRRPLRASACTKGAPTVLGPGKIFVENTRLPSKKIEKITPKWG